ncbi:hypothetical protein F383_02215 [Gossypium arboreum]|uniref:Uncharacterized protein n=1 Tax=Gossypium arboreum TaxID=29729 RepID=A0A0B0PLP2_GOSAR|nr:hypothetical protein F383_02215 [Gossypium arboreum]
MPKSNVKLAIPKLQTWSYTSAHINADAMSQTCSYTGSHDVADAMFRTWSYTGTHITQMSWHGYPIYS